MSIYRQNIENIIEDSKFFKQMFDDLEEDEDVPDLKNLLKEEDYQFLDQFYRDCSVFNFEDSLKMLNILHGLEFRQEDDFAFLTIHKFELVTFNGKFKKDAMINSVRKDKDPEKFDKEAKDEDNYEYVKDPNYINIACDMNYVLSFKYLSRSSFIYEDYFSFMIRAIERNNLKILQFIYQDKVENSGHEKWDMIHLFSKFVRTVEIANWIVSLNILSDMDYKVIYCILLDRVRVLNEPRQYDDGDDTENSEDEENHRIEDELEEEEKRQILMVINVLLKIDAISNSNRTLEDLTTEIFLHFANQENFDILYQIDLQNADFEELLNQLNLAYEKKNYKLFKLILTAFRMDPGPLTEMLLESQDDAEMVKAIISSGKLYHVFVTNAFETSYKNLERRDMKILLNTGHVDISRVLDKIFNGKLNRDNIKFIFKNTNFEKYSGDQINQTFKVLLDEYDKTVKKYDISNEEYHELSDELKNMMNVLLQTKKISVSSAINSFEIFSKDDDFKMLTQVLKFARGIAPRYVKNIFKIGCWENKIEFVKFLLEEYAGVIEIPFDILKSVVNRKRKEILKSILENGKIDHNDIPQILFHKIDDEILELIIDNLNGKNIKYIFSLLVDSSKMENRNKILGLILEKRKIKNIGKLLVKELRRHNYDIAKLILEMNYAKEDQLRKALKYSIKHNLTEFSELISQCLEEMEENNEEDDDDT